MRNINQNDSENHNINNNNNKRAPMNQKLSEPPPHSRFIQGLIDIGHDLSDYLFSETEEQHELKRLFYEPDDTPSWNGDDGDGDEHDDA